MKVILTESAEENLWQIYRHHSNYNVDYADKFQTELSEFIFSTLSSEPKMGTLFNATQGVYRMVYDGRYNIYYVLRDALYIVFVLDGRMQLNIKLSDPDTKLPIIT